MLPMMLCAVLINVLFHHDGMTVLWYFPTGNPLTLESLASAWISGLLLICVLAWFLAISHVITDEKLLYLFGRISPSVALILCMTMRLVPHFAQRCKTVADARRLLWKQEIHGVRGRIRFYASVLSGVITWSLEEAIDTADSMRCRGYGAGKRTSFFLYRFEKRDRNLLMLITVCALFMVTGMVCGVYEMRCYPMLSFVETTPLVVCMHLVSVLFFLLPFLLDVRDGARRFDTAA
ncbi:MAG: energy-coupling factor transporter transmembrane protein EcfT [Clostridia bacterium]|nr:energy-coupling factor transporter transmembrane protein EcfT [Clostridia bacterium]